MYDLLRSPTSISIVSHCFVYIFLFCQMLGEIYSDGGPGARRPWTGILHTKATSDNERQSTFKISDNKLVSNYRTVSIIILIKRFENNYVRKNG